MIFKQKLFKFFENIGIGLIVTLIISIGALVWKIHTPEIEMTLSSQSVAPYSTESSRKLVAGLESKKKSIQLLSITISKNLKRKISIDSIELIPCYEIAGISSLPPDSVKINNDAYAIKDSQKSRSGKECVFKGLNELPWGEAEVKIFFWGKFGYESEIDVSLNSPELGQLDAKKAGQLTGVGLFIGEHLEWLLIITILVVISICLYRGSKK
jgi:hypothetical protein